MKIPTTKLTFTLLIALGINNVNAQQNHSGINVSLMDKSVKPSDDFFRFVNGTWLDNTEIPADRTRWGSFDELRQKTDIDALRLLDEASKDPKYTSTTIKEKR